MSLDVYLVCGQTTVFYRNITHNLAPMADHAGIYEHLWRPEEVGITKAGELIEPLQKGLARLRANPRKYRTWNPPNGWGRYENLVEFVEQYLQVCTDIPGAKIEVSR